VVGKFREAIESPGGAAQWPTPPRAIIRSLDDEFPRFRIKLGVEYEPNMSVSRSYLASVPPLRGSPCYEPDVPTTSVMGYDLASLPGLHVEQILA